MDIPLEKAVVNKDSLKDQKSRRRARTEIKKKFEERLAAYIMASVMYVFNMSHAGIRLGKTAGSFRSYDFSLVYELVYYTIIL